MRNSLFFYFILTVLLGTSAFGQVIRPQKQMELQEKEQQVEKPRVKTDIDFLKLEKTPEQIIPQQQFLEIALDRAIDSTRYVMGPGDVILIKVTGISELQMLVEVSPEGYLLLPAMTDLKVAGKTFQQAKELIVKELNRNFRNSRFSVRLYKIRKFRVYVLGQVENPGTYFMRSSDRVSDALEMAKLIPVFANDAQVLVKHLNGRIDTVDVSRYYARGDLEANPYLQSGDLVFVPATKFNKNRVTIEMGDVYNIYQINPGENLEDFLIRVGAFREKPDVERIVLIRDGAKIRVSSLSQDWKKITLQNGDRILIPKIEDKVYVKGEVLNPGAIAFVPNYRARDYAGLAGILESAKKIDAIYVIRSRTGTIEKGGDVIVERGDIVVVPRRPRETFKEYLSILVPIVSLGISLYALLRTR